MNITESNASIGKRVMNNLIDIAGFFCFAFLTGILIGIGQSITGIDIFSRMEGISARLFGVILVVVYFVVFEGLAGKTPAKFITRTRVRDENGNQPGFPTILIRSLVRLVPFEGLAALGGEGRTLHDKWSGTYVIDEKRFALLEEVDP